MSQGTGDRPVGPDASPFPSPQHESTHTDTDRDHGAQLAVRAGQPLPALQDPRTEKTRKSKTGHQDHTQPRGAGRGRLSI